MRRLRARENGGVVGVSESEGLTETVRGTQPEADR